MTALLVVPIAVFMLASSVALFLLVMSLANRDEPASDTSGWRFDSEDPTPAPEARP